MTRPASLLAIALALVILAGCKPTPDMLPAAGRYTNSLRSLSWQAPPDSLIPVLSTYDFLFLQDLHSAGFPHLAAELRARHIQILAAYPFNRVWDYGNNLHPRRPAPAFGAAVYDALYPHHIAHLTPAPPETSAYYRAYKDTAIARWGDVAEYIVDWADPAVPALLAEAFTTLIEDAPFRPDGLWMDWWEYPSTGWWILAGPGYSVCGGAELTYAHWWEFVTLLRSSLGERFVLVANRSAPLDATAMLGDQHVAKPLTAVFHEHFPYGWGPAPYDNNSDYVAKALQTDGYKYLGYDSYRDRTTTRFQFLDNNLAPNAPYVSILSLFADGAVANLGPFVSQTDEWNFQLRPDFWRADPMNGLKDLGYATGSPTLSDNIWRREFDRGHVELMFNDRAVLPMAPTYTITHSDNPGGPFKYRVVIDGQLRYSGGGW